MLHDLVVVSEQDAQLITGLEVTGLALDSRLVKPNDLFIALSGSQQHGLVYADKAIEKGAQAMLYDPTGQGSRLAETITGITTFPVENLDRILGELAARFYGNPAEKLAVIGITGTNGKTSCSQFLGQLLEDCGIIGTLGWGDWKQLNKTINTTPDALMVQQVLADFVKQHKTRRGDGSVLAWPGSRPGQWRAI